MEIKTHKINEINISELISEDLIVKNIEDGTDLIGNLYYADSDRIVLYEQNITPEFFDLKNKMAGEILQKFSNYRIRLAIVGDFTGYSSKSLKDFTYESNNGNHVNFVNSLEEAIKKLSK